MRPVHSVHPVNPPATAAIESRAPAAWHAALKAAPLMIVLLFMRTRPSRTVTELELAGQLQVDPKTARKYLRQLARRRLIARMGRFAGYALTAEGLQTTLDLADSREGNFPVRPLKESLRKKEEVPEEAGFNGLTTERVLAETGRLFSSATVAVGISDRDPGLALAMVAHAFDQRAKLHCPQALVYRWLQKGRPPGGKYLKDPLKFLPNDYLAALGLAEPQIVERAPAPSPAPELEEEEVEVVRLAPAEHEQIWEMVRELLRAEMPRSWYSTYVANTRSLRLQDGVLTVGCEDQAQVEWLEGRVAKTVERMLTGVLDRDVTAQFVVGGAA